MDTHYLVTWSHTWDEYNGVFGIFDSPEAAQTAIVATGRVPRLFKIVPVKINEVHESP